MDVTADGRSRDRGRLGTWGGRGQHRVTSHTYCGKHKFLLSALTETETCRHPLHACMHTHTNTHTHTPHTQTHTHTQHHTQTHTPTHTPHTQLHPTHTHTHTPHPLNTMSHTHTHTHT